MCRSRELYGIQVMGISYISYIIYNVYPVIYYTTVNRWKNALKEYRYSFSNISEVRRYDGAIEQEVANDVCFERR